MMRTIRKILVYIDTNRPIQPALERATTIAAREGASLELMTVVETISWYSRLLGQSAGPISVVDELRPKLDALAAPLRDRGLSVGVRIAEGRRSLEVTRTVVAGGHDLLLKDGDAAPDDAVDTTDMRLMRSCPCPVWILRPALAGTARRVLAAVHPRPIEDEDDPLGLGPRGADLGGLAPSDENTFNSRILEYARWAASMDAAELHAVHAWRIPGEDLLRGDPRVDQAEVREFIRRVESETAASFDATIASYRPVQAHLLKGKAPEVIASLVAREAIDLLVLGTVARTGIAGYVIGNTAEAVLSKVKCSVLAVKPEGFVSPVTAEVGEA